MKRSLSVLAVAGMLMIGGATTPAEAGFGDAVVGGVVGGVVGSVITNEIYHSGRRHTSHRRSYHRRRSAPAAPAMTDEKRIQLALKSLGFYRGPIDGQINSFVTRNAIKELNRAYEIGDSAYMSPQERDALIYLGNLLELDKYLVAQGEDRRTKTRRIQAALKVLGFYTGKIDGSNGPMTRRAISEYRAGNGLAPSYRLGYEDEYRLVQTAKQANDRNIEETLASLKRLGAQSRGTTMTQPAAPVQSRQPVILQPTRPQPPMQGTITQEAPAPAQSPRLAPPVSPAPAPQPVAPAPVPVQQAVPQPVQPQSATPAATSQPREQTTEPVVLQPASQ
ncbi:peptidoglycan-binding domain-containing protein [Nitratifractor sp.]